MRQLVIGYTTMCLKEIDYENGSLMEFAQDNFWCWCLIALDCWYML